MAACNSERSAYPGVVDVKGAPWLNVAVIMDSVFVPENCWRGNPRDLTVHDILSEPDIWVRRIKMQLMGNETFLKQSRAKLLDTAGDLRLYRLPSVLSDIFNNDYIHMVQCVCPSTGREFFLRVPPNINTAKEAIAWTFGETRMTYALQVET